MVSIDGENQRMDAVQPVDGADWSKTGKNNILYIKEITKEDRKMYYKRVQKYGKKRLLQS